MFFFSFLTVKLEQIIYIVCWKPTLKSKYRFLYVQKRFSLMSFMSSSVLKSKVTETSNSFSWSVLTEYFLMKRSGLLSHWANSLKTLSLLPSSHIFLISSETLYCPLELGSTIRLILRSIAPWLKAGGGGMCWGWGDTTGWGKLCCVGDAMVSCLGPFSEFTSFVSAAGVSASFSVCVFVSVAGVSASFSVGAADLVDFGVSSKENRWRSSSRGPRKAPIMISYVEGFKQTSFENTLEARLLFRHNLPKGILSSVILKCWH